MSPVTLTFTSIFFSEFLLDQALWRYCQLATSTKIGGCCHEHRNRFIFCKETYLPWTWINKNPHDLQMMHTHSWVKESQPVQKIPSSYIKLLAYSSSLFVSQQGAWSRARVPTGFTLAYGPCRAFSSFSDLAGTFSVICFRV